MRAVFSLNPLRGQCPLDPGLRAEPLGGTLKKLKKGREPLGEVKSESV
jgi:hypothetical protein